MQSPPEELVLTLSKWKREKRIQQISQPGKTTQQVHFLHETTFLTYKSCFYNLSRPTEGRQTSSQDTFPPLLSVIHSILQTRNYTEV